MMSAKFQINSWNSQARKIICLITEYVPLWERYYRQYMGKWHIGILFTKYQKKRSNIRAIRIIQLVEYLSMFISLFILLGIIISMYKCRSSVCSGLSDLHVRFWELLR